MTMTDPIADFLTRIRNGQQAKLKTIESPYSKMRHDVANVLCDEGYLRNVSVKLDDKGFRVLVIELKYVDGRAVIQTIDRVSSPGRRVYSQITDLKPVANGLGMNILSTSKGVMSDFRARAESVGGEVLCKVF